MQCSKIHKAKYDRIKGRYRQFNNTVRYFNTSVSIMARTTRQKNNKYIEDLNHSKPTRPNKYPYNTPHDRIQILLYIFQDRPSARAQNRFQ